MGKLERAGSRCAPQRVITWIHPRRSIRSEHHPRCQESQLVVYLIAAPLFLVASYFIKDQRTKTAFMILAGMSLVMYFVSNFGS